MSARFLKRASCQSAMDSNTMPNAASSRPAIATSLELAGALTMAMNGRATIHASDGLQTEYEVEALDSKCGWLLARIFR